MIFLNIIIIAMATAFSIVILNNDENFYNFLTKITIFEKSKIELSTQLIIVYSFLLYSTFPFLLGIVIVSYIKEFGELELMMLFPINRKYFFLGKIICIFCLSIIFAWLNFLLCILIQYLIFSSDFIINYQIIFYMFAVIPVWLFFISCLTVIISAFSKDSKEANQKSLLLPFILLFITQGLIILKVNVFSELFLLLPFGISLIGSFILLFTLNRKFNLEKIMYK